MRLGIIDSGGSLLEFSLLHTPSRYFRLVDFAIPCFQLTQPYHHPATITAGDECLCVEIPMRMNADLYYRFGKQMDKTTEVEILKADLEERGFNIKVCIYLNSRCIPVPFSSAFISTTGSNVTLFFELRFWGVD